MNAKKLEKKLRKLPTEQRILNGQKRVEIVKGEDIFLCCKKLDMTDDEIYTHVTSLIEDGVIIKALLFNDKKTCNVTFHSEFKRDGSYIWVTSGSTTQNLLISLLVILFCLAIAMFQMWPSRIRGYSVYVAYLMMAFIAFILILGVIRLIVFCISVFSHPPGIWLFPNLFADVGFIDSFIPVWSYHGVDTKPVKED